MTDMKDDRSTKADGGLEPYFVVSRFLPRKLPYSVKFLSVAFVGIHVPLIGLLVYFILTSADKGEALPVLVIALILTLVGTGATLYLQYVLLGPVRAASEALKNYQEGAPPPNFFTRSDDDAAVLLGSTQKCLERIDTLLEEKKAVLGTLSHDFRSPIASIAGISETIVDLAKEDPEILEELAVEIREKAYESLRLCDNLITVGMQDRSQKSLQELDIIEVSSVIEKAAARYQGEANRKDISLRVDCSPDVKAETNTLFLNQILNNLLSNALKFTPKEGSISIVGKIVDEQSFRISVEDTGCGIPPAILEKLFRPKSGSGREGLRGEASNGIGLWLCQTFAKLLGTEISVDSVEEKGTTFSFDLPRA